MGVIPINQSTDLPKHYGQVNGGFHLEGQNRARANVVAAQEHSHRFSGVAKSGVMHVLCS
ncbi:hypothetical protein [Roseinatronobacter sp. NSM]|uniref:hypothetical protein n=1 Tax=Roseinatronobacter sp. NSM TaxID=3457785 RepID=UPI0040365107